MTVTVYSKPSCVQCTATYKTLESFGIDYETVDVSVDEAAADRLRNMGFLAAPVVMTSEGDVWAGFRRDKIEALAA